MIKATFESHSPHSYVLGGGDQGRSREREPPRTAGRSHRAEAQPGQVGLGLEARDQGLGLGLEPSHARLGVSLSLPAPHLVLARAGSLRWTVTGACSSSRTARLARARWSTHRRSANLSLILTLTRNRTGTRTRTRTLNPNPKRNANPNPNPNQVCSTRSDFYLQGAHALKGTPHPVQYHVLLVRVRVT